MTDILSSSPAPAGLLPYPFPLDQLLHLDLEHAPDAWAGYLSLGFTDEHMPELIRMLNDRTLLANDNAMALAPIHAWRTLAALRATAAIPALLNLLHKIDDDSDEWIDHEFELIDYELPLVFRSMGPVAIPLLTDYMRDGANGIYSKACACSSLSKIGIEYPEHRSVCIEILTSNLQELGSGNDHFVNGCLISALLDLKAVEAIDSMRTAFAAGLVDPSIAGDMEDVEIELGLRQFRATPKKRHPFALQFAQTVAVAEQKSVSGKIGRNDPCPCGSGKKFKKCCLH